MKIGRSRGPTYYWDTCIFLHWLSDPQKEQDVVDGIEELVDRAERQEITIFTSTITRIEVLRAKLDAGSADRFASLFPRAVEWVNVDPRVAAVAHDIRNFYFDPSPDVKTMRIADCIHLATAIVNDADEMNTLDGSGKRQRPTDLLRLDGNVMGGKYPLAIKQPRRTRLRAPEKQGELIDFGRDTRRRDS